MTPPQPSSRARARATTRTACCCALACALVAGTPATANAVEVLEDSIQPQVVVNAGFDTGLLPWSPIQPNDDAITAWSPLDASGDLASGSIQFVNLVASAGSTLAAGADCFAVASPGMAIRVRFRYHVAVGSARLWLDLWTGFKGDDPDNDPECMGPGWRHVLGGAVDATPGFVDFDSGWMPFLGPLASFDIGVVPHAPWSPYIVHIDDVQVDLGRISTVFEDGLENH